MDKNSIPTPTFTRRIGQEWCKPHPEYDFPPDCVALVLADGVDVLILCNVDQDVTTSTIFRHPVSMNNLNTADL